MLHNGGPRGLKVCKPKPYKGLGFFIRPYLHHLGFVKSMSGSFSVNEGGSQEPRT